VNPAELSKPSRKAGERLSLELTEATILWLMQEGRAVSERSVREILGGSPNDILPLIREWYAKRAPDLLAGRIVVMAKDSVPEPLMALYKAVVEDAAKVADERVAALQAAAEEHGRAMAARELEHGRAVEELGARARTIDSIVPALRAELDLARADAAAQSSARVAVQVEKVALTRDLTGQLDVAKLEIAELSRQRDRSGLLKDAAEAKLQALEREAVAATAELARLRAEASEVAARQQAVLDSVQQLAAAQRAAHGREVDSIKERHADAAARWADSKLQIETALSGALESKALSESGLRVSEEMVASLQSQLDDERAIRKSQKEKLTKSEESLRQSKAAVSVLEERLAELNAKLEKALTGDAPGGG